MNYITFNFCQMALCQHNIYWREIILPVLEGLSDCMKSIGEDHISQMQRWVFPTNRVNQVFRKSRWLKPYMCFMCKKQQNYHEVIEDKNWLILIINKSLTILTFCLHNLYKKLIKPTVEFIRYDLQQIFSFLI